MNTVASNFHWKCTRTWNRSAKNTLWCLMGCAIGGLGTILFFQITGIPWSTLAIMIPAPITAIFLVTYKFYITGEEML